MPGGPLIITLHAHAYDARGETLDLTWAEFVECVRGECENPAPTAKAKTSLPAIGPYELAADQTRSNEAVQAITVGALDLDGLTDEQLNEAFEAIDRRGLAAVAHTSPSDGDPAKPGRRVRIYVELDTPIDPLDSGRLRMGLARALGVTCDPNTLEPARIMFVGRLAGTPEREVCVFEGNPAPGAELIAAGAALGVPRHNEAPADALPEPDPGDPVVVEGLLAGLAAELSDAWAADGRQEWVLPFMGWMARWWHSSEREELVFRLAEVRDENTHKYLSMSDRAKPLTGPNAAVREALGEAFAAVDRIVNAHPNAVAARKQFERLGKKPPTPPAQRQAAAVDGAPIVGPAGVLAGEGDGAAAFRDLEAMPLAVTKDRMAWIIGSEGEIRDPLSMPDAAIEIEQKENHRIGSDGRGKDGELLSMQKLMVLYGRVVLKLRADYASRSRTWEPETQTLTEGYAPPAIAPKQDVDVAAWLRLLAGNTDEGLAELCDWIAGCAQHHIAQPAAALVLVGPTGVGKTVLFTALAEMWGMSEPVPLTSIVQQFNAGMAKGPVWLDDETQAMRDDLVSSSGFRQLTQARVRSYEPKGKEKRELHGAARIGITANGADELQFSDVRGGDAVDAVSDRLALFDSIGLKAELEAALSVIRVAGSHDVDLERVRGHIAWLWATVVPRQQRFLGARRDQGAAKAAVMASAAARSPAVYDALRDWVESPEYETPSVEPFADTQAGIASTAASKFAAASGAAPIFLRRIGLDGTLELYVHPAGLQKSTEAPRLDLTHAALGAIYQGKEAKQFRFGKRVVRYRRLDVALVCAALPGLSLGG